MVQFKKSKDSLDDNETATSRGGKKLPVKLEIAEDPLEDQNAPPSKRCKGSSESAPQWGAGANANHVQPSQYNPLDEPSPLGLQLRKSPSLLELIQMRLSQGEAVSTASAQQSDNQSADLKKNKAGPVSGGIEKLKASNFPASILRIGSWEYKSRYEGDLVAKCYFAKHKLVWEVLEGGLKSKIEIQWSDVMALKANCPDTEPGTLTVVLARQPLFFRETNPQPRKHTLWQATADFTNGQASMHRKHFLECPQGLLNKHFEKLIQCDMRLNFLSRQPEIVLDSPYFEQRPSVFEDPDNSFQDLNQVENLRGSSVSSLQDMASPSAAQSSSLEMDRGDHATTSEHMSREAPSPSSVMDARVIEGSGGRSEVVNSKGLRDWDQIRVPGLHPSMSLSDLVNCISEQMTSGNAALGNGTECQDILDDISQYLLSDNQTTTSSDEKKLMARVNSLCCLLKMDPATNQNVQGDGENGQESDDRKAYKSHDSNDKLSSEENAGAASNGGEDNKLDNISQPSKQVQGMSRKDSFGDLLLHLPRITSLPKFLFNISEDDGESKA